jgi:hypothetical protein
VTGGETGKVPDFPQTRLAFRVWRFERDRFAVRSLNAPGKNGSWVAKAMSAPGGDWPHRGVLSASCRSRKDHEDEPVPGRECTCGIYATTGLGVINTYLSRFAPVLGVVELGGRVIPATNGYRAASARVAAILLIDEALTEPHAVLRKLAAAYRVPAVVPHSDIPESYRDVAGSPTLATEAEEYLKNMGRP